jgi:hypothetical protein
MADHEWLLFIAQLPAYPSSVRVRGWRKLREAGAASLQNGVWILPKNEDNTLLLELLLGFARQNGGSGQIFTVEGLNQDIDDDILERFRADREQEYGEFLEQCEAFVSELEKETKKHKFSFAELEENEQNLQRLRKWIGKIQKRDFLATEKSREAINALQSCRQALQVYARKVYAHEGIENQKIDTISEGDDSAIEAENDDLK